MGNTNIKQGILCAFVRRDDTARIEKLLGYVINGDIIIGNIAGDGFASAEGIAKIIGVDISEAKSFLGKLMKMNIVAKMKVELGTDKMEYYMFNPVFLKLQGFELEPEYFSKTFAVQVFGLPD